MHGRHAAMPSKSHDLVPLSTMAADVSAMHDPSSGVVDDHKQGVEQGLQERDLDPSGLLELIREAELEEAQERSNRQLMLCTHEDAKVGKQ